MVPMSWASARTATISHLPSHAPTAPLMGRREVRLRQWPSTLKQILDLEAVESLSLTGPAGDFCYQAASTTPMASLSGSTWAAKTHASPILATGTSIIFILMTRGSNARHCKSRLWNPQPRRVNYVGNIVLAA